MDGREIIGLLVVSLDNDAQKRCTEVLENKGKKRRLNGREV